MKKTVLAVFTAVLMCLLAAGASAADEGADVYVSISDGSLRVAAEKITVTDADSDGALTINDALILAHDAKYEGGSEAGYTAVVSDYGLAMSKLWGVENGTGYGYYLNNTAAMNLSDPVKDGDYVYAFVYTDTTAFSDVYCYFDENTIALESGNNQSITLTLSAAGYDENWAPIVIPVEGATITVNGAATEYKTDADGKVTISLNVTEDAVISAFSDTATIVPPVCNIAVDNAVVEEETVADETSDTAAGTAETDAETGSDDAVTTAPQTADIVPVIIVAVALAGLFAYIRHKKAYVK